MAEEGMTAEAAAWPEYCEEKSTGRISIPSAAARRPASGPFS